MKAALEDLAHKLLLTKAAFAVKSEEDHVLMVTG